MDLDLEEGLLWETGAGMVISVAVVITLFLKEFFIQGLNVYTLLYGGLVSCLIPIFLPLFLYCFTIFHL